MVQKNTWLLPDGIEEVLPDDAACLEQLRRNLLDVFARWGYELVIPPLIDYLGSLLTGTGHDLDLQTFKLTDQLSGELLGIRADMTPQVARIDAHNLGYDWPTRLCYVGTILHTRGESLEKTRIPMQIGAELYGHAGIESDAEVILLMLEMLANAEIQEVHLDLGHVGIFHALSVGTGLQAHQEAELFDVLQRKDRSELSDLLNRYELAESFKSALLKLPELHGGVEVLDLARQCLPVSDSSINNALCEMEFLVKTLQSVLPGLPISFDLAELRGYHYHTGVVFSAFIPGMGKEIARGGRYNNIGAVFGRSRPATGFSADLKLLSSLTRANRSCSGRERIFAPYVDDVELVELIRDLRAQGRVVLQELPGQVGNASDLKCTSILKKDDQGWIIAPL